MAAAAALPVASVGLPEVSKLIADAGHGVMEWARQPFFTNTRTTTRSWTEIDKNGKAHALVETKTRGFAISNGTVLGILLITMAWEAAYTISRAMSGWFGGQQGSIPLAMDILAAPVVIAYDEAQAVVGIAKQVLDNGGAWVAAWDWLNGEGPTKSTPPPTSVKTAAMPATAMAGLNQLFVGIIGPGSALANQIGSKATSWIQNPNV